MLICLITFAPFLSSIILSSNAPTIYNFAAVNSSIYFARIYIRRVPILPFRSPSVALYRSLFFPLDPFPKRYPKIANRCYETTTRVRIASETFRNWQSFKSEISRSIDELGLRRGICIIALGKRVSRKASVLRDSRSVNGATPFRAASALRRGEKLAAN